MLAGYFICPGFDPTENWSQISIFTTFPLYKAEEPSTRCNSPTLEIAVLVSQINSESKLIASIYIAIDEPLK